MSVRRPPRRAGGPYRPRPKRSYAARLTHPALRDRRRLHRHTLIGILLLAVAVVMVPTHLA